jgi:hypothetical protein
MLRKLGTRRNIPEDEILNIERRGNLNLTSKIYPEPVVCHHVFQTWS